MADILPLNTAVLAQGFGAYLTDILPADIATACGAFSASMRQIRNIESVPVEKFAQIATNIETIKGLGQINGTDVPTNLRLSTDAARIIAIGSGPDGTFTTSDFFGSMSGLPYPWTDIQAAIQSLQTTKLSNIYNQLFLAVTWEKANCTITTNPYYVNVQPYIANASNPDYPDVDPVNPYIQCGTGAPTTNPTCQPRIDNLYYTVTISASSDGGGYGRGTAPAPTVALSPNNCGASVSLQIGTDDTNAGPQGGGTFGRISQFAINNGSAYMYGTATNNTNNSPPNQSSGPYAPPVESVTVQAPPTATLAVTVGGTIATGGVNTAGDTYYSVGSSSAGTAGWPSPMNSVVQGYIDQANDEILTIKNNNPQSATKMNTLWDITGTQLTIEQRSRNIAMSPVPIPQDIYLSQYPTGIMAFIDSMPSYSVNTLPHMYAQTIEAICDWKTVGGQSVVGMMRQERNQVRLLQGGVTLDNNMTGNISPKASKLLIANGTISTANPGAGIPVDNATFTNPATLLQVDENNEIVAPNPIGIYSTTLDAIVVPETFRNAGVLGTLPTLINDTIIVEPGDDLNEKINPVVNYIPSGPTVPLDTGKAGVSGSLAGSSYQNAIPTELKLAYIAGTLSPASFNVQEAIDEVIKCNCDCWID